MSLSDPKVEPLIHYVPGDTVTADGLRQVTKCGRFMLRVLPYLNGVFLLNMALMVYVFVKAFSIQEIPSIPDENRLVIWFNFYLPCYFFLLNIGFAPPLTYLMWHKKWTAPPFNYPKYRINVVYLHTMPALLWLVTSTL